MRVRARFTKWMTVSVSIRKTNLIIYVLSKIHLINEIVCVFVCAFLVSFFFLLWRFKGDLSVILFFSFKFCCYFGAIRIDCRTVNILSIPFLSVVSLCVLFIFMFTFFSFVCSFVRLSLLGVRCTQSSERDLFSSVQKVIWTRVHPARETGILKRYSY